MTAVYPGGAPNTYVPSTEATGKMVVDFSRNPDSFAINKYMQIVPVDKQVGLYTKLGFDEGSRILQTNLNNFSWADGDDEPSTAGYTDNHEFLPYACKRYVFGFRIGELAVEQASWDILAKHAAMKAQQAMTARTQIVTTLLQTAGNWPTDNTAAVTGMGGGLVTGKWDVSTTARMDIKKSLDYAMDTIRLGTAGAVLPGEFVLVMSPGCARKIAVSQEIVDFIKGSTDAKEYIGNKLGPNAQYGLPASLYGVNIVIEDAVKVTSRKGATRAASYVNDDTKPFLVSRPGGLTAPRNSSQAPNFSTACMFMYTEMAVESKHDTDNKVHKGRVVENYAVNLTAGISGFLFTAAVAP